MMTSVLLVEDDPAIADILRWALEKAGYRVLETSNGKWAFDLLQASATALVVLLDHGLPDLDGLSLLKQISVDPRLATTHAYVLMSSTSLGRSAIQQQVSFPAPIDVLPKPFELRQLWRVLATATRRIEVAGLSPA